MPVKKQSIAFKVKLDVINRKSKEIRKDRIHINNLVDIIKELSSDEPQILCSVLKILPSLFEVLRQRGDLVFNEANEISSESDVEHKYHSWILERYSAAKERSIDHLKNENFEVHCTSIFAMFSYMKIEALCPNPDGFHYFFPKDTLKDVLFCLLKGNILGSTPSLKLQEYMTYPDISYHTVLCLKDIIQSTPRDDVTGNFLSNLIHILELIEIPNKSDKNDIFLKGPKSKGFTFGYKNFCKVYSEVWLTILKCPLSATQCQQILIKLHDNVLPHLTKPLLVTDFLMDSYAHGGVIGLLSLNGVFKLMQDHNLDYPKFYEQLYSLVDSFLFSVKQKHRVFTMLDLFLSSTHLPEYLVAAFVKKFSRLALKAPAPACVILLKIVTNLLIRHKGLRKLYDNPVPTEVSGDPFDVEETDLNKCHALESSLWEILTLQYHAVPFVSEAAKFISRPLPRDDIDITKYLKASYEEMTYFVVDKMKKEDELQNEDREVFVTASDFASSLDNYWKL